MPLEEDDDYTSSSLIHYRYQEKKGTDIDSSCFLRAVSCLRSDHSRHD